MKTEYDYINIMYIYFLNALMLFLFDQNWGSNFSCVNVSPSASVPTSGKSDTETLFNSLYQHTQQRDNCIADENCFFLIASTIVHKLRPGDIKVVAAVGDSSTVRAPATQILHAVEKGSIYHLEAVMWSLAADEIVEL